MIAFPLVAFLEEQVSTREEVLLHTSRCGIVELNFRRLSPILDSYFLTGRSYADVRGKQGQSCASD